MNHLFLYDIQKFKKPENTAETLLYCERTVWGRVYSQWLLKAANQCLIIAHSQDKSALD